MSFYNSSAEQWDATRQTPWPEFELLKKMISDGARVLDLGCGNGRLYPYLKENLKINYTGIDNAEKLITIAKKHYPDADFQIGDALDVPFNDNSFDFVANFAVLHHISRNSNRKLFFSEMARVLKRKGKAFVTVWNIYQPKYHHYLKSHLFRKLISTLRSPSDPPFSFNDVLIPFGQEKIPRYIHAFTPAELRKIAEEYFDVEEMIFTRKGERVNNWMDAHNLCVVLKKH